MRILICEDNILALRTLSIVLEKKKCIVDSANEGYMAMDLIGRNTYDLIIIDLHLPFHSGLEILQHIRKDLRLKTPVLVVTAISDTQVQRKAEELGIEGYIRKPFNPEEISSIIEKISISPL